MTITQAIILAAGRGERMRPLTETCPKPLLLVQGKPLMVWHLENLARAGVQQVVINTAWLEEQFAATLGDGSTWGLRISYSHEGARFGGALETAGGIATALPLLDRSAPFWVLAGDVYAPQFDFSAPHSVGAGLARDCYAFNDSLGTPSRAWPAPTNTPTHLLAHLYLVANPTHNAQGDFGLSPEGLALDVQAGLRWTYSTIGLYRAALFDGIAVGQKAALAPLLRQAMRQQLVSAELYAGAWTDVGTPARLAQLNLENAIDRLAFAGNARED